MQTSGGEPSTDALREYRYASATRALHDAQDIARRAADSARRLVAAQKVRER